MITHNITLKFPIFRYSIQPNQIKIFLYFLYKILFLQNKNYIKPIFIYLKKNQGKTKFWHHIINSSVRQKHQMPTHAMPALIGPSQCHSQKTRERKYKDLQHKCWQGGGGVGDGPFWRAGGSQIPWWWIQ